MQAELAALHEALPGLPFLEVADRGKQGAVKLTRLSAQPAGPNLSAIKRDLHARWGMVALIDMLKESILRTGWWTPSATWRGALGSHPRCWRSG